MSWQNILKTDFKFEDLKFVPRNLYDEVSHFWAKDDPRKKFALPWAWWAKHSLAHYSTKISPGIHVEISIVGGEGARSQPRHYLDDPMEYDKYEVAFIVDGKYGGKPEPLYYQSKEDIEDLINGGYVELLATDTKEEML